MFLGRIVPEKGIHYLIDAYNQVSTSKKLVIAGGASDTDSYYEELRKKLPITKILFLLVSFKAKNWKNYIVMRLFMYCQVI